MTLYIMSFDCLETSLLSQTDGRTDGRLKITVISYSTAIEKDRVICDLLEIEEEKHERNKKKEIL